GIVPSILNSFFSSRRRHTSFSRDWSSDVCSFDFYQDIVQDSGESIARFTPSRPLGARHRIEFGAEGAFNSLDQQVEFAGSFAPRSEERRVGNDISSPRANDAVTRSGIRDAIYIIL